MGTGSPRTYVGITAALLVAYPLALTSDWQATPQSHTLMEAVATVLALVVGLVALVRFHTHRTNSFLFVAAGFIGTGLLDGYHAFVTRSGFDAWFPSPPASLIPWSWNVSRIFLALMMFLGWWFWRRENRLGTTGWVSEKTILMIAALLTPASFLVLALVPLPGGYFPDLFFHRPEELFAGGVFLLALIGHLHKGAWREQAFEHWVVLSLILGVAAQSLFMSHSARLFDAMFGAAHLLKIGSYGCVFIGLLASVHELLARAERNARELRESEAKLRGLFENVPDGIYRTTPDGKFLAANPACVRMLGYLSEEELRSLDVAQLYVDPGARALWTEAMEREGALRDFEVDLMRRDGSRLTALDNARSVVDEEGRVLYYEGTLTDITERKKNEERLEHMASFDGLTGLPNRHLFEDRLRQAIAQARRTGERFAVHFLDLDNFKTVNDTFGHSAGDEVLAAASRRLSQVVREGDTLGRLGGDEFAVLQRDARDVAAISVLAHKLLDTLAPSFLVEGQEVHITTSIGIALSFAGAGSDQILTEADVALYKAKEAGRNTFQLHDEVLAGQVREHAVLHQDLHGALERGEFFLEYQPQVDLGEEKVIGVEALVRWRHPRRGLLYPSSFIPVCERSGLMVPLGAWILEEACRQRRAWRDAGTTEFPVAVNISAVQLKAPGFGAQVLRILERTGLPPELLELELTETVLMRATDSLQELLGQLHARGIRFAIDDFGTGHSSLRYLTAFQADKLKIAMEFVSGVGTNREDDAIVDAVIGLGHKLGRKVIAEGVETVEQLAYLRARDCDEAQGFHFSRPVRAEAFGPYGLLTKLRV
ncbi:MAG TPA: EAL domain-containing protein [Gemmatimonadota bacterium]|nr:EAL domain-containing protein [Gemmatimonadota bacterium]